MGMKYITGALVIMALLGEQQTSAVRLQTGFTDDLIKSLTEDMAKDEAEPAQAMAETKTEAKETKKTDAKADAKKDAKEEPKDEIPMDAAAIKAYSSVIADAAEDSEPSQPVQYSAVIPDEEKKAPVQNLSQDPMGSMIQNEISEIKDASIKAAKDKDE